MPAKRAVDLTASLILFLAAVAGAVGRRGHRRPDRARAPSSTRQSAHGLGGRTFAMLTFRTRRAGPCSPHPRRTAAAPPPPRPAAPADQRGARRDVIVGPRPQPPQGAAPGRRRARARRGVRPGITGLWQMSGTLGAPLGGNGRARPALCGAALAGTRPGDPGPQRPPPAARTAVPPGQGCLSDTDHRVPNYSAAE